MELRWMEWGKARYCRFVFLIVPYLHGLFTFSFLVFSLFSSSVRTDRPVPYTRMNMNTVWHEQSGYGTLGTVRISWYFQRYFFASSKHRIIISLASLTLLHQHPPHHQQQQQQHNHHQRTIKSHLNSIHAIYRRYNDCDYTVRTAVSNLTAVRLILDCSSVFSIHYPHSTFKYL